MSKSIPEYSFTLSQEDDTASIQDNPFAEFATTTTETTGENPFAEFVTSDYAPSSNNDDSFKAHDSIDEAVVNQKKSRPNNSVIEDLWASFAQGSGNLISGIGWLAGSDSLQETGQKTSQYWSDQLSEKQFKANQKPFISADQDGTWVAGEGISDPRSWAGMIAQSLPSMAPGMGAAGMTAKGLTMAGVSNAGVKTGAVIAGSAVEGATIAGSVGSEVEKAVMSADQEYLDSSPFYQQMIELGFNEKEAREATAEKAAEAAAYPAGVGGALLGAYFNKYVSDAVTGNLSKRFSLETTKGAAIEGATEALQGGLEGYVSERAKEKYAGMPFDELSIANNVVAGTAAGSAMGGFTGAAGSLAGANTNQSVPDEAPETELSEEEIRNRGFSPEAFDLQEEFDRENAADNGTVEFEKPTIGNTEPTTAIKPNGSEIEFESYPFVDEQTFREGLQLQPMEELSFETSDYQYENGIDFPQNDLSRMDELAAGIEKQVALNTIQPREPLMLGHDGAIAMPGPVAGNANTGLEGIPENVGRMDSDPAELRQASENTAQKVVGGERYLENKVSDFKKDKVKAARQQALPQGLTDERWLRGETENRPSYVEAVKSLTKELVKGGGIDYVRDANDVIVKRTKSLNPEWAQELIADEATTTGQIKIAVDKAVAGKKKLSDKQARIVSRLLDVVESEYNSPENIEHAKQQRLEKNVMRKAQREESELLEHFEETNKQIPFSEDYAYLNDIQFDDSDSLAQDELDVAEALVEAMHSGVSSAVTDELTLRIDDPKQLSGEIRRIAREKASNDRQGDTDGRSEETASNEEDQSSSTESSQRESESDNGARGSERGRSEGDSEGSDGSEERLLETYTEEDLKAREESRKSQAKKEAEAEAKEKADAQVDDFQLKGSDRPADANPDQDDLFAEPASKRPDNNEDKAQDQSSVEPKEKPPAVKDLANPTPKEIDALIEYKRGQIKGYEDRIERGESRDSIDGLINRLTKDIEKLEARKPKTETETSDEPNDKVESESEAISSIDDITPSSTSADIERLIELSEAELSDSDKSEIRLKFAEYQEQYKKANTVSGAGSHLDGVKKHYHLGMTGGSGRNVGKLNKRREQAMDRSVKNAGLALKHYAKGDAALRKVKDLLEGKGTEKDLAKKAESKEARKIEAGELINGLKKGDKVAGQIVLRVNKDQEGYPISFSYKGDYSWNEKIDFDRIFFDGSREELKKYVDLARSKEVKQIEPDTPDSQNNQTFTEQYDELWKRIRAVDESLSLDDIKAYVRSIRDNKEEVVAQLQKMTKAQLFNYFNGWADKSTKKDRLVNAVYKDLATAFGFLTTNEQVMIVGGSGISDPVQHVLDKLDALSEKEFRENLNKRAERREKRESEYKKKLEGIKEPKTLEDFRNAVRVGGSKDFTPEQWAAYDRLHADERLEKQAANQVKTVESVSGDVNYSLHETKHSQKGFDLFVVSLADRVDGDLYRELNTKAKQLGGYYSRYNKDGAIPGFQFKSEQARADFLKVLEGDSVEKTKEFKDKTESLLALAERIEERATSSLNQDRKTNTQKRAREAGYAIANAESELAEAAEIRAIATAIQEGKAKYLSKLSAGTELDAIRGEWNSLKQLAQYSEEGKRLLEQDISGGIARGMKWKKDVSPEQKVRFAEYPLTRVYPDTLKTAANQMIKTQGYKLAGQQMLKLAKDKKDKIYIANSKHFGKFKEYIIKHQDNMYLEDVARDYNRMQKLGIETTPMLRAALLEYAELSTGAETKQVKSATSEKLKYADYMGKYKDNDFFNTTSAPAEQVIELADLQEGMTVFEPSAGLGHLADAAAKVVGKDNVTTNELSMEMSKFLKENGYSGTQGDFLELGTASKLDEMESLASDIERATSKLDKLNEQQSARVKEGSTRARSTTYNANASNEAEHRDRLRAQLRKLVREAYEKGEIVPQHISSLIDPDYDESGKYAPVQQKLEQYDRVIMNPPFSKDQEITHIEHAYQFLKPGGRLVAITSSMAGERSNKRNKAFREWLDSLAAEEHALPEGSFKDAINPTGVNTKIIVIDKPESDSPLYSRSESDSLEQHISKAELDDVVKEFMSYYNDNIPVESFIVTKQEEAYGPNGTIEKLGKVEGAYHPRSGVVVLAASNIRNNEEGQRTLRHELLGHYGLNTFTPKDKRDLLEKILASRSEPSLKETWSKVDKLYSDKSELMKAEEVFAFVAEQKDSLLDKFLNFVHSSLQKILRKAGLAKGLISKAELRNIARQIAKGIKAGNRPQQNFPKSDDAQFRRSDNQTEHESRMEKFFEGIAHQPIDRMFRLPFDATGMIDSHGRLKGSAKLSEAVKDKVHNWRPHPEGRFAWMDNMLEIARHGLIDRYKLTDEYKQKFREAEALGRNLDMQALDILNVLEERGIDGREAAVLQQMLTGEDINNSDLSSIAEPILRAIDDLGLAAVEYGVITREQFERNRGSYLHRSYLKHEGEFTGLSKWVMKRASNKAKKIAGKSAKGRGIERKLDMDRLLRHVPKEWFGLKKIDNKPDLNALTGMKFRVLENPGVDPSHTGTLEGIDTQEHTATKETIYWPSDLSLPSKYADYRNRGTFEVRGKSKGKVVLWRDYTKAERLNMGEIIDARYNIAKTFQVISQDIAMGKFFQDVAQNDEWFVRELPPNETALTANEVRSFTNLSSVEWVQVPETKVSHSAGTKQWGALAGGYVRAEIWRDLNELDKIHTQGLWRKLLTQWKMNKTARSPVVHMNNVMSNFILMDLADVRMSDLWSGIKSYHARDEHWRDAQEHGAFEGTFANEELRRKVLEPILDDLMKQNMDAANDTESAITSISNILSSIVRNLKKYDQAMTDAYQVEDELYRMATYMRRLSLGDSAQEAALIAREQFLDYDIRAPWINAAKRTVLPFISYTYRVIPVLSKAMSERPWKLAKYATIAYLLNTLAYELEAGDEDEERRTMREDQEGSVMGVPKMMRLPASDENYNPYFLDIKRWIPAGDIFDMNQRGALNMPEVIQFGGPLMLAAEFAINKQAFNGKEITKETDSTGEALSKTAKWLYKSWMPSAAYIPGSHYNEKLIQASMGGTDIKGQPLSVPLTLLSSIGIKAKPHDVELGYYFRMKNLIAEKRLVDGDIWKAESDYDRHLITKSEYNKKKANAKKKLEALKEEESRLRGR